MKIWLNLVIKNNDIIHLYIMLYGLELHIYVVEKLRLFET